MCAEKGFVAENSRRLPAAEKSWTERRGLLSRTALLVLIAFSLRLFFIFPGPLDSKVEFLRNKADLRNYYWPAQAALRGENPYVLWANGQSGEFRADMAPLELLVYQTTVAVWNDPRAIQILFALFDALNIALLGSLFKQSSAKLPFQLFYALGPLTLYNLTLVPEDKTIVITLTLCLFLLLARSVAGSSLPASRAVSAEELPSPSEASRLTHHVLRLPPHASRFAIPIVILAALVASFKWLSVFYLFPLLLFVSPNLRQLVRNGILFALVVAFAHLPWLPAWSYMYTFRLGRVVTPFHIAPSVLLNAIGLYDRTVLLAILVVSLLLVYGLFWFRRIDIFETIALSASIGILWTPDMDPVHLSLLVLFFLLIIDWSSSWRQSIVWLLSAWVAFVYAVSTRSGFTRYGLPDLQALTGAYGSLRMILLSYPLFLATVGFYLHDRLRRCPVGGAVLGEERETC